MRVFARRRRTARTRSRRRLGQPPPSRHLLAPAIPSIRSYSSLATSPDITRLPSIQDLETYARPSVARSLFQLANTALLFVGVWLAMVWSLQVSYLLTLALSIPAAGLLVRLFI